MMDAETAEPIARLAADTCATLLSELAGAPFTALDLAVRPADASTWAAQAFPAVVVGFPFEDGTGESLLVLAPADARSLASLVAPDPVGEGDELADTDLSAIAKALDTLFAGAFGEHALAASTARVVQDAAAIGAPAHETWAASYRVSGESLSVELVQTMPGSLAPAIAPDVTDEPVESVEPIAAAEAPGVDDAAEPTPDLETNDDDGARVAVERAATIAADATASVLSDLFSEEVSASTPVVDTRPAEPLGLFDFPVVLAEVSYVAGVSGSTHFVIVPGDAALLAAAMMGTPETTGDGLSPIELSAVSEAMNQLMTATAGQLAKALGIDIEVSPPACVVVDSLDQARERVADCAYRSTFTLASTIFGAEIVQIVSSELAESLTIAFAEAGARVEDDPFAGYGEIGGEFAEIPLGGAFATPESAPEVKAGAREILSGIRVRVSAELGRAKLPIARVANLPAGSVVMLDRAPTDPVDVLVNGTPFAQAKVVLVDGEYAVQIVSLTPLELNN